MRLYCYVVIAASVLAIVAWNHVVSAADYSDFERSHWSFQIPKCPPIPAFADGASQSWVNNSIDAFVLRRLRDAGLNPAASADRRTLLRRATFNLTGLPPSVLESDAFIADEAEDAYEKVVDRLLASPRYGERWGQHWLDVVRFAESEGFEYDQHRAGAWRFRDYVIAAFNDDKPYDQFVIEQLAGDELKLADPNARRDAQIAAGFHRLGPIRRNAGNAEVAFSRNEVLTEMTNAIGDTFLGLTIGCARCHDHMFDPIRQSDYYEMQAFLAATFENDISLADARDEAHWNQQSAAIREQIEVLKEQLQLARGADELRISAEIKAIEASLPDALPTVSSVRNKFAERTPIHVLERGDETQAGHRVEPAVLGVLVPEGHCVTLDDSDSPKSDLAAWLVDPRHPLTARVIVNRLWQYHFGAGLVRTANDFGLNGDDPSHPELLDFLATELIRQRWHIKPIQRMILLSRTYQQASRSTSAATARERDPDNRLLWRQNRQRLTAEQLRDAMLDVAGSLNLNIGGPSIMLPVEDELLQLLYKPTQWQPSADRHDYSRRSVYLAAKRNLRIPFMQVFDQPDLQTSCPRRDASTHAPQALELLNGELSNQLAERLADRLSAAAGKQPDAQVELAFQLVTARLPTEAELQLGRAFLARHSLKEFALAMFNLNAFLYVD